MILETLNLGYWRRMVGKKFFLTAPNGEQCMAMLDRVERGQYLVFYDFYTMHSRTIRIDRHNTDWTIESAE